MVTMTLYLVLVGTENRINQFKIIVSADNAFFEMVGQ